MSHSARHLGSDGASSPYEMRRQTQNYIAAVIREHPEFKPSEPQKEPVPVSDEVLALREELAEKDRRITELCAELEALGKISDPFAGVKIAKAVAKAHGITFQELVSARRHAHLVKARQHAMYEMRQNTGLSLPQIGKIIGKRDHSTVLHALRRHEARLKAGST